MKSIEEMLKYLNSETSIFDEWWKKLYKKVGNITYWFKSRFSPRHMYHVVWTDLEPGWHDVDYVLLHACFGLLCRFVEDENGGIEKLVEDEKYFRDPKNHNEWDGESLIAQANDIKEIIEIYNWWKYVRVADQVVLEKLCDPSYTAYDELETKMLDDEQKMLHRLIDIRRRLWT